MISEPTQPASEHAPALCVACDTCEDRARYSDYGAELARVVVGATVRVAGLDGDVTARVVRMDTPTLGVIEVLPEHGQGQPYRALFSAHNVMAIEADPFTVDTLEAQP